MRSHESTRKSPVPLQEETASYIWSLFDVADGSDTSSGRLASIQHMTLLSERRTGNNDYSSDPWRSVVRYCGEAASIGRTLIDSRTDRSGRSPFLSHRAPTLEGGSSASRSQPVME